jgi:beta-phosphoglucomutase-like phosphatase (HAD superfamily)
MYEAILFDMDGTLVDTVDVHVEAWARAMKDLGRPVGSEEIKKYKSSVGKTLHDILADIYGREEADRIFPDVRRLKNIYFRQLVDKIRPIIYPEMIRELAKRYYTGVVSSSTKEAVNLILDRLGYRPYISVVVSGEDIKKGKPDP